MTNDNFTITPLDSSKARAFNPFNKSLSEISSEILTPEALLFLEKLHTEFNSKRLNLLNNRDLLAEKILNDSQFVPGFKLETESIRNSEWSVAPCPHDLEKRHVEITGPAEAKMIINAMNCGANIFMADLEDALSPTWENVILGQKALKEACNKTLGFKADNGKEYKLNPPDTTATLLVRPRGLHLDEKNIKFKGESMSGSLVDFGLYFFHNAKTRMQNNSAPYFYLPKLESHLEARWWNDVFVFSQEYLKIPKGTIRATMLIETCLAALSMDEMLFELKDHASGLNAGRWDYIFSFIKKFNNRKNFIFPDRGQVTMTTPFMQSYCELIVKTCHKRNAHAIGGMAAFIPNRKEPEITEKALANVIADKSREVNLGFDGTWVAHPDLVSVAKNEFQKVLADRKNQKEKQIEKTITADKILNVQIDNSFISENGIRTNINVALLYIERWLNGTGAAALYNLMEDAATAEISRSELWQWLKFNSTLNDGRKFTETMYQELKKNEIEKIKQLNLASDLTQPEEILDYLVLNSKFPDFLTTYAYKFLN